MTNLPKILKEQLENFFYILDVGYVNKSESGDGTVKYLFNTGENDFIEAVYLKDKNKRITFCISSQSGCRMGCAFCMTGKMGLKRNLNFTQIISQILFLSKVMSEDMEVVDTSFNIVFMGMGEPLDNFENLTRTIEILTSADYFNMPQSRITVSTCGLADKILPLMERFNDLTLAMSLISADQKKRENVIPIAKKYDVDYLLRTLNECHRLYGNRITLEYVLIRNFNMDDCDIEMLKKFKTDYFHLNIIPVNSKDESRPSENEIKAFMAKIARAGFNASRRYRRGDDIQADCGQLFWDYKKAGMTDS